MPYLNKEDETKFFNLLSCSEMIFDNLVETLLSIKGSKKKVEEALGLQKEEILSSLEGYPTTIDRLPVHISFLKEKGFCFDVNVILVKLCGIYSTGTSKRDELNPNELRQIGKLYYDGKIGQFIEKMIELFRDIKLCINNTLRQKDIIYWNLNNENREKLIQNRKSVNWLIHNMKDFVLAYSVPVDEKIMSYFDQDKQLLFLSHIATSTIMNSIQNEYPICEENIRFVQTYAAYILHRRKENPTYNPTYNFEDIANKKTTLISADSILTQNKEYAKKVEEFKGKTNITEEELLDFLPNLKRELKIKDFKKSISLGWELIPEKEDRNYTGRKMPIYKSYKPDALKKEIDAKKEKLLEEKIELFASLPYILQLKGINHFDGYEAYVFENGKVILEKFYQKKRMKRGKSYITEYEPTLNEAIYVMDIKDFKELSKMGKTEIRQYAKENGLNVRPINHTKYFKNRVLSEVNSAAYTEDVLNYIEELVSLSKKPEELRK